MDNATIAEHAWACSVQFNELVSQAISFEDGLGRFNIWAWDFKVFAPETHASLDYQLRYSPEEKTMIMWKLKALQRKLRFALDTLERHNDTSADEDIPDDPNSESPQPEGSISTTSSSSFTQTTVSETRSNQIPLFGSPKDLEETAHRIYQMSRCVRSWSTDKRRFKAREFAILDENGDDASTQFETFALRIVEARFPEANPILHKRIANIILRRRKMFNYEQRHQEKLPKVVRPGSAWTDPSVSSSASSSPDTTAISFPPAPEVAPNAKEFQCPYCGLLLGIKETSPGRWRKHVIQDLEPYVCLFEDCDRVNPSFRDVYNWTEHMRMTHTRRWRCGAPNCEDQVFYEQAMFANHLELFHPGTYTSSDIRLLCHPMRRRCAELVFQSCPLCNYVPEVQEPVDRRRTTNLEKHIAAHLEELALLSLPWQDDVDECFSDGDSLSEEKRSTLKKAPVNDLDEVSLTFDDPPKPELSLDEQHGLEKVSQSEATTVTSGEAEWGFVPSMSYDGHSQDPILQSLMRKFLTTHIEDLGTKHGVEHETGAGCTQVELQAICWICQ